MLVLKDPDAKLPFSVDWSAWLANESDEAASVDWSVPVGITKEISPAPSLIDGKATVWLSGGTLDRDYPVTCHIVTVAGRTNDYTLTVMVRDR